ncbi:dTDP-4-dehydrorhamnose 3,5-epimerase [Shewanella algae]|uniref:dTDP-4-dehydrorhamnose 3,5-epimerase n=1 Tax=Shewanella algae TaxID=38313 RepID=UPI001BEEB997|nr:dTDP-4-dehydrorhamnose 3,5-epimerase [Shewanella chilikensis]
MKLIQTKVPDVVIIEPTVFGDERGWFMESFNENKFHQELEKLGLPTPRKFVQDNHSMSKQGILRGLHYQTENTQGKLVRVVSGEVFDVAVDIRKDSPTFGQWVGVVLSAENKRQLWVPEGFAHGFYVMSEKAEFLYKTTDYYAPEFEESLDWADSKLAIDWPITRTPELSKKDIEAKSWAECKFL